MHIVQVINQEDITKPCKDIKVLIAKNSASGWQHDIKGSNIHKEYEYSLQYNLAMMDEFTLEKYKKLVVRTSN